VEELEELRVVAVSLLFVASTKPKLHFAYLFPTGNVSVL